MNETLVIAVMMAVLAYAGSMGAPHGHAGKICFPPNLSRVNLDVVVAMPGAC